MDEADWRQLEQRARVQRTSWNGIDYHLGDRVRLCPRRRADILDLVLKGKLATIQSIEQDYEDQIHLAVVLDDDPGRDLGEQCQSGHRFFFGLDEVESLVSSRSVCSMSEPSVAGRPESASATAIVLIAGIGNIFHGDDAFGCEVVRRLSERTWPESVRIVDFGIRGLDLAYALMDHPELTILVDAMPMDEAPGTLRIIRPETGAADPSNPTDQSDGLDRSDGLNRFDQFNADSHNADSHTLDPLTMLRWVASNGQREQNIVVVGCQPMELGGDEGHWGLSDPVAAAVDPAADIVASLVEEFHQHRDPDRAS